MTNWKSIRLELGGTQAFPAGSVGRAYVIRLPLGTDARVDEASLVAAPSRATVQRYWSSDPDERGTLVKCEHGWIVRCNGSADRKLELDGKTIRIGQQITIRDGEGTSLPLRVASIR